jgi:hypothetical protein
LKHIIGVEPKHRERLATFFQPCGREIKQRCGELLVFCQHERPKSESAAEFDGAETFIRAEVIPQDAKDAPPDDEVYIVRNNALDDLQVGALLPLLIPHTGFYI